MTGALLLPWSVVFVVLLFSAWQQRRWKRETNRRRHSEHTLRTTAITLQRMHQAIESASDAIGIGDFEGTSLYHNRAHVALFGYTVEELNAVPGKGVLFADPVQASEIHASLQHGRSWSGEIEVRTKSGRSVPAFVRADIIRDEQGQPVGIFGVFTDITERRRMLSTLQVERQRLATTLQSIAEGVIITDENGLVERMNQVAEQVTGWVRADAVGEPLSTVFPLLDEATRVPRLARLRHQPEGSGGDLGRILLTKEGRERLVAAMAAGMSPIGSDEQGRVIVFRDVTHERREAAEREQAKRLEALGLLAGGIAHDFANLLTAILGHLTLAQTAEGLPANAGFRLAEVERTAWRARELTQQLLTFARGGTIERKRVELGGVIREAVALALPPAGGVTLALALPEDLWAIEGNAGQLIQVINNLALNAVQAMGESGDLRIVARNVTAVATGSLLDGCPAVHVCITDTGPGIAPDHLPKIFNPFFTTKRKGTGLGLATAYSIIKKHGGSIQVESMSGVGTTFQIFLPAERGRVAGEDARLIG